MPYDYKSSLPAYQENKEGKLKSKMKVLEAIKRLQPCSDKMLSAYTDFPINIINGRRNELVKEDKLVVLAKKDRCPYSNRLVSFWKIKEINYQPVMF